MQSHVHCIVHRPDWQIPKCLLFTNIGKTWNVRRRRFSQPLWFVPTYNFHTYWLLQIQMCE